MAQRVSQLTLETTTANTTAARVSQVSVEAATIGHSTARVSQVGVETASINRTIARVTQLSVEILTDPAQITYAPVTIVYSGTNTVAQVSGTAGDNKTITITEQGTVLGTTVSDGTGHWTFNPSGLLPGQHTLTGSDGISSASVTFTLSAVVTPPVVVPVTIVYSGTTTVAQVSGTAGDNKSITVSEAGTVLGTTVSDSSGHWTFNPTGLQPGSHTLTGSDGTTSASVTFTLSAVVTPPVVTPPVVTPPVVTPPVVTPPVTPPLVTYQFQLKAVDPDNGPDPLVFALQAGSTLPQGLVLSSTGLISGQPVNQPMNYTFTATVSDGLATVPRTFGLQVVYVPPYWITPAGDLGSYPMSQPLSIQLLAADTVPGATLTFTLASGSSLPQGLSMSPQGLITGTPVVVLTDTTTGFTVLLDDGAGQGTISQVFTITDAHVNRPPVWNTPVGLIATFQMNSGQNTVQVNAMDPDGDTVTYSVTAGSLPSGLSLNAYTGTISGVSATVTTDTTYTFTITADDGNGGTTPRQFTIVVKHTVHPPVWVTKTGSLGTFPMLTAAAIPQLSATDPDGFPITYSVTVGTLPGSLVMDSAGNITGTLDANLTTTSYTFSVTAADSNGGKATQIFSITNLHVVRPPVWITPPGNLGTFPMSVLITPLQFSATDPDNDVILYAVASGTLPTGLTLNPTTGIMSGTPAAINVDQLYNFVLQATNPAMQSALQAFALTVMHTVRPPVWQTNSGNIGQYNMLSPMTATVVAIDPDNVPVTYAISGGSLPAGLTLDGTTGIISGTPAAVLSNTTYAFTVTAQDGQSAGLMVQRAFSITVGHIDRPPVWVSPASNLGTFQSGGSITPVPLLATSPDGDLVTYRYAGSSLIVLQGLTVTGTLLGGTIPALTANVLATFVITATDTEYGATNKTFTVVIQDVNQPPRWVTGTMTTAVVGMPYSYQLVATDSDGPDPLAYSIDPSNSMPSGLAISPAGVVSGTLVNTAGITHATNGVAVFSIVADVTDGLISVPHTLTIPVVPLTPTWVSPVVGSTIGTYLTGVTGTFGPFLATSPNGPVGYYAGEVIGETTTIITPSASGVYVTVNYNQGGTLPIVLFANDTFSPALQATWFLAPYVLPKWLAAGNGTYSSVKSGTAFTLPLPAVSPHTPVTFSLASGTLPFGLTFNDAASEITGTLPYPEPYNAFVVKVTDANGYSANSGTFGVLVTDQYTMIIAVDLLSLSPGSTGKDLIGTNNVTINSAATKMIDPFGRANAAVYFPAGSYTTPTVQGMKDGVTCLGGYDYFLNAQDIGKQLFTFEFWLYKNGASGFGNIICCYNNYVGESQEQYSWAIAYVQNSSSSTDGSLVFIYEVVPYGDTAIGVTTPNTIPTNMTLPPNTWTHVALTSDGTTFNIWINGVAAATLPVASYGSANGYILSLRSNYFVQNVPLYVKNYPGIYAPASNFGIASLRMIYGPPLYTAPFTPPTAPFTGASPDAAPTM